MDKINACFLGFGMAGEVRERLSDYAENGNLNFRRKTRKRYRLVVEDDMELAPIFQSFEIPVGETLDFWRVEAIEPDRLLRLAAEMKLPGREWLRFGVAPTCDGSVTRQTAVFDPAGLAGLIYWYALYPVHMWIFSRMLSEMAASALRDHRMNR